MPDKEFKPFTEFPDDGSNLPDVTLVGPVYTGHGILVSQDADNLYQVSIDIFLSPDPADGSLRVTLDGDSAEGFAQHMLKLAEFAQIGETSR